MERKRGETDTETEKGRESKRDHKYVILKKLTWKIYLCLPRSIFQFWYFFVTTATYLESVSFYSDI